MIVENLIDAIFKTFSLFIRNCYPYILIVEVVYQTFGIEENFTFDIFRFITFQNIINSNIYVWNHNSIRQLKVYTLLSMAIKTLGKVHLYEYFQL